MFAPTLLPHGKKVFSELRLSLDFLGARQEEPPPIKL
jgi:hypothetical protein